MTSKRVLVTGARGFVGRHCLPALAARGYEIHGVTSHEPPAAADAVHWHRADLLEPEQAARLCQAVKATHLLHLAWMTAPGQYWSSPENVRWLAAGLHLIQAFAEHGGQRVVGAGTCAEYDWTNGHCDERRTLRAPATVYGATKHALHLVLDTVARDRHLSVGWGRIFFLYGPGEHPSRLVASVVRALVDGRMAACSAGTQVRDFLYVKDVADAFAALLDSNVTGAVNIASGQGTAVRELVLRIATLLGRPDLVQFGAPADEVPVITASTERLHIDVGWQPRYTLDAALTETCEWWKAQERT